MGKHKPYYNVCPNCGCNIDPGELCDCKPLVKIVYPEKPKTEKHNLERKIIL